MVAHIVKVDLDDPNIDLTTTPEIYLGGTTSTFLSQMGASVAINGSGFLITSSDGLNLYDPIGYNAGQGILYSNEAISPIEALISEDNVFTFSWSRPAVLWDALSGMNPLMTNGVFDHRLIPCNTTCSDDCGGGAYCTIDARTSLGYDRDNNDLVIIVVEGDDAQGEGAKLLDLAQMMNRCGADTANNQDGGGSSTLVAATPNSIGRSDINHIASERVVANHLGICIGDCNTPSDLVSNFYIPEGQARPRPNDLIFPFDCNNVAPDEAFDNDNEFHSLRPYQASPCNPNKEDLALFCGNDLFVGDYVTISKDFDAGTMETYIYNGTTIDSNIPFSPLYNPCLFCNENGVCEANRDPNCIPIIEQCSYEGSTDECGTCTGGGATESCSFTINSSERIAIDVSGAEFPIMGYTEPSFDNTDEDDPKVINSINPTEETMDHPTKMNEYVSWYLNGVNGRAEYPYLDPSLECIGASTNRAGQCLSTRTEDDGRLTCLGTWGIPFIDPFRQVTLTADGKSVCVGDGIYCCVNTITSSVGENTPGSGHIVNYSGPVKKLLPFSIQNIVRTQEVSDGYESDENNAQIRHSQIVGCYLNLLAWIPDIFGVDPQLIVGLPVKCYGNDFFGISFLNGFLNELIVDDKRLSDYNGATPPIEDEEEYLGEDFSDWIHDYKEWRGYTCIPFTVYLPVIGHYTFNVCLDNPLEPNILGNLFSYVPLSSTEDRLGDVKIESGFVSTTPYSSLISIISTEVTNVQNADLFFPHMEESNDLSELLQKTFAYDNADLDDTLATGFTPYSPYCDYYETRSNPGDELFAGELSADVEYTAQVLCTFYNWGGTDGAPIANLCENLVGGTCVSEGTYCSGSYYYPNDCGSGYCCTGDTTEPSSPIGTLPCTGGFCVPSNWVNCGPETIGMCPPDFMCVINPDICGPPVSAYPNQSCTNLVMVNLDLETRTPLANKVWTKLVAGSSSIFRRMFPRIGPDSSFEGIYDMPASTDVSYTAEDAIVFAGDPANQSPGSSAQLYFPHIGGIKEYFLTGIQTLLRPKGMGRQPVFWEGEDCLEANDPLIDSLDSSESSSGAGSCGVYAEAEAVPPFPGGGSLATCTGPTVGWCSPATLTSVISDLGYSFTSEEIREAGIICLRESGGWTNALNDCCVAGISCDFSIGLFQINALPGRCDDELSTPAFTTFVNSCSPWPSPGGWFCGWDPAVSCCTPTSDSAAQECIEYWSDPLTNIEKMARMYTTNHNWCSWRMGDDNLFWCGIDYSMCYY